jgi:predicted phosphoribosyltransferase
VGEFYEKFEQVSDEEVIALLHRARQGSTAGAEAGR